MRYLSTFKLSDRKVKNPNIYPYNVFAGKDIACFVFDHITILYGNNASGKSTILNILAQKLNLKGAEEVSKYNLYFYDFIEECSYGLGEDELGKNYFHISPNSRYIKSEDILYEIKKVQQASVLEESIMHEQKVKGMTKEERDVFAQTPLMWKMLDNIIFSQEKYSNGEVSLQIFDEMLETDALYLLDEPEVSLSPQNQIVLAEKINAHARLLGCQFIIATHSPFMLGTLNAKIYNLDDTGYPVSDWRELENVKFYFEFFKQYSV